MSVLLRDILRDGLSGRSLRLAMVLDGVVQPVPAPQPVSWRFDEGMAFAQVTFRSPARSRFDAAALVDERGVVVHEVDTGRSTADIPADWPFAVDVELTLEGG